MQTQFEVHLSNFSGPFDLLLELISERKLDVTEVALHLVTDDFIAFTKNHAAEVDFETLTYFLIVGTTLLEIKAAQLLPGNSQVEMEDLAVLETRDLLFAKLLEYQAIKQIAQIFYSLESNAAKAYPRLVSLESQFTQLLPEVDLGVNAQELQRIAQEIFQPRLPAEIMVEHVHKSKVSVAQEANRMMSMFTDRGMKIPFSQLIATTTSTLEIVASFLAVLDLYRDKILLLEQAEALADFSAEWTGEKYSSRGDEFVSGME